MKLITVFGRYCRPKTNIKYTLSFCISQISKETKSIEDTIQEMKSGNGEAYLGLTDSIVGMIKFFPPCEQGSPEEIAMQKVMQ